MLVAEYQELGYVVNNTAYEARYYDKRPEMKLRTQTMLISKLSLSKGDVVLASVRMLRNSRQIISVRKIDQSAEAQVFLEFVGTRNSLRELISNLEQTSDLNGCIVSVITTASAYHGGDTTNLAECFSRRLLFDTLNDALLDPDFSTSDDMPVRYRMILDMPNRMNSLFAADVFRTAYADNMPQTNQLYVSYREYSNEDLDHEPERPSEDLFSQYEWIGDVWIPEDLRPVFPVVSSAMGIGTHLNMLLTGPSGYGKTTFFKALADWLDVPYVYVNCATVTDVNSWFGTLETRDGSTFFDPTDFTKAVESGNCVIILDEANRLEPWLTNSLMPLLDHRRATTVHHREIRCGDGIVFGLTMNQGSKYAGTSVSDAAFINRMDITAEVTEPSRDAEIKLLDMSYGNEANIDHGMPGRSEPTRYILTHTELDDIVDSVRAMRTYVDQNDFDVDVSTRTSNKIAKLMMLGSSLINAIKFAVIFTVDFELRKGLLDVLASRKRSS